MVPDKLADVGKRLRYASGHLNTALTMVEKELPFEEVLHQSHALQAALQAIG